MSADECRKYLAGKDDFSVQEIEVF